MNSAAAGAGSNCVVEVSDYTRVRNNKLEHVSGYERSNPYCNDNTNATGDVILAKADLSPRWCGN